MKNSKLDWRKPWPMRSGLKKRLVLPLLSLGLVMLEGCAPPPPPPPPLLDRACRGFRPFPNPTETLPVETQIWVIRHNTFGSSYCGPTWTRN